MCMIALPLVFFIVFKKKTTMFTVCRHVHYYWHFFMLYEILYKNILHTIEIRINKGANSYKLNISKIGNL